MLTVWSVLWGDKYPDEYPYILRDMVKRNLSTPHKFKCLTDHNLHGIDTVKPIENWHGWWQKLCLFGLATGPSLYFDLDVVITGDLDYLVPYTARALCAPANWGQSGHGGIQSSVMAWNGTLREPYQLFNYKSDSTRLWGDQEYLSELYGDNYTRLPRVYSYKYHCKSGLPDDCSVAVFHGKPDPHEVGDKWVKQARLYTPTHNVRTRSNLPNTLATA